MVERGWVIEAFSGTATKGIVYHLCEDSFCTQLREGMAGPKKKGQTLVASQFSLLVICWFLLKTPHYFKGPKQGKIIHEICMVLRVTFPVKNHNRLS